MPENKNCIEKAVKALEEHYPMNARNRTMEYTYGYFDALAVLKSLSAQNDKSCKCRVV